MSDSPLIALAADAGSGDPIAALRALSRMRSELERMEAAAVRRARTAGASWQMVALCLGVTRQAVHKKYGRR